jgi:hypothetical protein
MKTLLAGLYVTALLTAADVTGTWSGGLSGKKADGSPHSDTAHVILKQEGAVITGTAGGDTGDQHPIRNGKIEGDDVTFELVTSSSVFKIALKLAGDELKGQVSREREGRVETMQLDLKRAK